jgi:perosamine synthetase
MNPYDSLPALLGGPPVRPQGPTDWPIADPQILEALQAAFHEGSWGRYQGGHVERLEQRLAEYHQLPFALTCGSGTFAVELALRALRIGPGDEVVLPAYDYGGNFLCVHAVGATPVLVDVEPGNWNVSAAQLSPALGPKTRAVLVSHLHGGIVPMQEIMDMADSLAIRVIEDAAQAPGAIIDGRRAGTWGDVGILSFGGSKLLTAGRGGALLTPHADIYQRARTSVIRGNHLCPLSELQAAVLLPQLEKLDERNAVRRLNVQKLREHLADIPGLRFLANLADNEACYYKLGLKLDQERFGLARDRTVAALRAEGMAIDEGFRALHVGRSPSRFRRAGDLTEAERAHHGCLILHHPVLLGTAEEVDDVALALRKVQANAEKLKVPSADGAADDQGSEKCGN